MTKQQTEKEMLIYEITSMCKNMHIDIDRRNLEILDVRHLEILKGKVDVVKLGVIFEKVL